jgi:hypothetical protein
VLKLWFEGIINLNIQIILEKVYQTLEAFKVSFMFLFKID